MIPIGLETSSRPSPVTSRPSDFTISFETMPVTLTACPKRGRSRGPRPRARSRAGSGRRRAAGQRDRASTPRRCAERSASSFLPPESPIVAAISSAFTGFPSIATMRSPACRPTDCAGEATPVVELRCDGLDRPRRLTGDGHEEEREEHDREGDVGHRAGADRDEPLPGRRLPVGVRAERVAQLGDPLLGRGECRGRDALLAQRLLEVVDGVLRARSGRRLPATASRDRPSRRAPVRPPRRARTGARRRAGSAGACRGSSRSLRAGSRRSPYSMPLRVVFAIAGGKPT